MPEIDRPSTPMAQDLYDVTREEMMDIEEEEIYQQLIRSVESLELRLDELES